MENKRIVMNYLKDNNYNLEDDNLSGIKVEATLDNITIRGSKLDLIDLADLIVSVALSEYKSDHVHVDDLTLISEESKINEIVIEKEG